MEGQALTFQFPFNFMLSFPDIQPQQAVQVAEQQRIWVACSAGTATITSGTMLSLHNGHA